MASVEIKIVGAPVVDEVKILGISAVGQTPTPAFLRKRLCLRIANETDKNSVDCPCNLREAADENRS